MLTKILSGITALLVFTTAAFAEEGSIVSVNKDTKQIEVKVGDKTHAVAAASVTLLDAEGNVATLDDFAKDDKVEVTIVEGSVTKIQLTKEDARLLGGRFSEASPSGV